MFFVFLYIIQKIIFLFFFPVLSGTLMYLNEATLLNNVRVRYIKDHIYVCFPLLLYCICTNICIQILHM